MADRSITATLRLNIQDLRAKAREAGQSLKGIGDQAKQGSGKAKVGFSQIGKSLKDNRAEWDLVAGAALKGGAVIAAGVGLAVKTYADFDKQMSNVAATGDDARQNIDGLRESAIKLGADTQYSAGEAAQGIEELLKAGVSAADVMGGGLAGALNLAAAGQIGVAEAAETAATAMVQFKLSGQDVPHIADLLAAAAGKAQGGVGDMAAALKQSGLVASQFGLSIEETTGSLAAFASAGLLGSDAGTSFRTMLLRMANPSGEAAGLMKELGINAYDAQGNFVGMASLAGQLKDTMGGLSQAQRDQALATIFGSDAIRAANVLYEQGSAGIQQWISDVDDAGFAAVTAATKTDNLAGDIERFGGAIDTLMIRGGEGGNNFLRGVVQGAEDAVEALGGLPQEALTATTGIAGVAAAGLLAFGGISKLAVGVADTRAAMKTLNTEVPPLGKALRGLQVAGGVAVGVTALFTAVSLLQGATTGLPASLGQMANAVSSLIKSGSNDALNRAFTIDSSAFKSIDGLGSAFSAVSKNANDAVYAFGELGNAILPVTSEYEQAKESFGQLDKALAAMDTETAAEGFLELSKQAAANKVPIDELVKLFPQLQEKAYALAESVNYEIKGPHELAAIMQGQLPAAMQVSVEASKRGQSALETFGASALGSAESIETLTEKLLKHRDVTIALTDSEIAFEQAIDDAAERAKKYSEEVANGSAKRKDALNADTQAGRENLSALNDILKAGKAKIDQLNEMQRPQKEVTAAEQRMAEEWINSRAAVTGNRREAERYAIELGLIPKKVTTDISPVGLEGTKAEVKELQGGLDKVDKGAKAEILTTWHDKGLKPALAMYREFRNREVYLDLNVRTFGLAAAQAANSFGASFVKRADGGMVGALDRHFGVVHRAEGGWGSPGNGSLPVTGGKVQGSSPNNRADNIPAMLTAREFVHPEPATDLYGFGFMEAVRSRRFPKALAMAGIGLADGGMPAQSWQPSRGGGGGVTTVVQPISLDGLSIRGQLEMVGSQAVINGVIVQREQAQSLRMRGGA